MNSNNYSSKSVANSGDDNNGNITQQLLNMFQQFSKRFDHFDFYLLQLALHYLL